MLGPDAVPEALARADIAIILVPKRVLAQVRDQLAR